MNELSLKEIIDIKKIPRHVAVIMDGNGRWAKKRGNKRIEGHRNALQAVRNVVEASGELGVHYLTLYAFSTENWNRPKLEVNALMTLFIQAVKDETENLIKNIVKMRAIGDIEELPVKVRSNLFEVIEKTKNNTGLTLILALN
jgi:undecaprenyl diphosphate synthase